MARPSAADQGDLRGVALCDIDNWGGKSARVVHLETAGVTFVGGVELDLGVETAEALERLYDERLGGVGKVFTWTSRS